MTHKKISILNVYNCIHFDLCILVKCDHNQDIYPQSFLLFHSNPHFYSFMQLLSPSCNQTTYLFSVIIDYLNILEFYINGIIECVIFILDNGILGAFIQHNYFEIHLLLYALIICFFLL